MTNLHLIDEKLLTNCRYIKNGKTVAELRIKDASNHQDRSYPAIKRKIDFDHYFLFYKYEFSGKVNYGDFHNVNPCYALGMDKNGKYLYFFDSESNKQVIKVY